MLCLLCEAALDVVAVCEADWWVALVGGPRAPFAGRGAAVAAAAPLPGGGPPLALMAWRPRELAVAPCVARRSQCPRAVAADRKRPELQCTLEARRGRVRGHLLSWGAGGQGFSRSLATVLPSRAARATAGHFFFAAHRQSHAFYELCARPPSPAVSRGTCSARLCLRAAVRGHRVRARRPRGRPPCGWLLLRQGAHFCARGRRARSGRTLATCAPSRRSPAACSRAAAATRGRTCRTWAVRACTAALRACAGTRRACTRLPRCPAASSRAAAKKAQRACAFERRGRCSARAALRGART